MQSTLKVSKFSNSMWIPNFSGFLETFKSLSFLLNNSFEKYLNSNSSKSVSLFYKLIPPVRFISNTLV